MVPDGVRRSADRFGRGINLSFYRAGHGANALDVYFTVDRRTVFCLFKLDLVICSVQLARRRILCFGVVLPCLNVS